MLLTEKEVEFFFFFLRQMTTLQWYWDFFEAQLSNEPRLEKFQLDLKKMAFSLGGAMAGLSALAGITPPPLRITFRAQRSVIFIFSQAPSAAGFVSSYVLSALLSEHRQSCNGPVTHQILLWEQQQRLSSALQFTEVSPYTT